MRIRDESEYCISITRFDPKNPRAGVSDRAYITDLYQAYRPTSLKISIAVTPNQSQSPGYPALLNPVPTKNNFLSNDADSLAGMFFAEKEIHKKNCRSSSAAYSIAQRHEVFENRMFHLKIVN